MSDEENFDPMWDRFLKLLRKPKLSHNELHECVSYLVDELYELKKKLAKHELEHIEGELELHKALLAQREGEQGDNVNRGVE